MQDLVRQRLEVEARQRSGEQDEQDQRQDQGDDRSRLAEPATRDSCSEVTSGSRSPDGAAAGMDGSAGMVGPSGAVGPSGRVGPSGGVMRGLLA